MSFMFNLYHNGAYQLQFRDELLEAGPMPGGYRSVEDETEGFRFFHLLVKSRLIRKLHVPPP